MRRITIKAVNAFNADKNFKLDNTRVEVSENEKIMFLHDNKIIFESPQGLFFTFAGWPTATTKSRLRGFLKGQLTTKNRQTFYNGTPIKYNDVVQLDKYHNIISIHENIFIFDMLNN